jgi:protein-tyrosine-phosphatase
MAAAFFNAVADPKLARAISAGTEPGPRIHLEVLAAMSEVGIDLTNAMPQQLTEQLASGVAVLVTMGCGEQCPVVPGLRRPARAATNAPPRTYEASSSSPLHLRFRVPVQPHLALRPSQQEENQRRGSLTATTATAC